MSIASSYSLLGTIQEPRSKFSLGCLLLSLEPKGQEGKKGQQELHKDCEKVLRVVDLADLVDLLGYIVIVLSDKRIIVLDIVVRHGVVSSFCSSTIH